MNLKNGFLAAVGAVVLLGVSVPGIASAKDGEKVFNKCKACHSLEAGVNKVGPSLAGVVGRKAGTAEGYNRYMGLKDADWSWDEAALMEYLEDPSEFTKKKNGSRSAMSLKLKKEDERKAVIEYLKEH